MKYNISEDLNIPCIRRYILRRYYPYCFPPEQFTTILHLEYVIKLYVSFLERAGLEFLHTEALSRIIDLDTGDKIYHTRKGYITLGETKIRELLSIRAVLKKYGIIDPIAQEIKQ